jgi:hypothetical protein
VHDSLRAHSHKQAVHCYIPPKPAVVSFKNQHLLSVFQICN